MIGLLFTCVVCCVFPECCGPGAADVGVWDGCEGAGGLCQEASPRKVSFRILTSFTISNKQCVLIYSILYIFFSLLLLILRFL